MSKKHKRTNKSETHIIPWDTPEPQLVKKFHTKDLNTFKPLTQNQRNFFELYNTNDKHFILAGSAGVGKSHLGLYALLFDVLDGKYDKLIIVRSAVQSREQGFLKGSLEEKLMEYELPFIALFDKFFKVKNSYNNLKKLGLVEFHSSSFVRGITFDNSAVFVDEAKSMNFGELDSIITRVGENSRIIIAGDLRHQNDLNKNKYDVSGLLEFLEIIKKIPDFFNMIEFTNDDIVRSGLCKQYIIARDG